MRVGPKTIPKGTEKTYRLKVEELAEPIPENIGSAIGITITFALPVFLGKPDVKPATSIAALGMQDGKLAATKVGALSKSQMAAFIDENLKEQA